MTAEQIDLVDMTDGAIELPCDARKHDGNAPAEWIVWQFACCRKRPRVGFCCDPCLQRFLASEHPVRCEDCGHRKSIARHWIIRFERIHQSPAVA